MSIAIFPHNLRVYRTARGLSQAEISKRLHIQRQTYCNYENGRRLPSLEMAVEIASILEVDLTTLVTGSPGISSYSSDDIQSFLDYMSLSPVARAEVRKYIQLQKNSKQ